MQQIKLVYNVLALIPALLKIVQAARSVMSKTTVPFVGVHKVKWVIQEWNVDSLNHVSLLSPQNTKLSIGKVFKCVNNALLYKKNISLIFFERTLPIEICFKILYTFFLPCVCFCEPFIFNCVTLSTNFFSCHYCGL